MKQKQKVCTLVSIYFDNPPLGYAMERNCLMERNFRLS